MLLCYNFFIFFFFFQVDRGVGSLNNMSTRRLPPPAPEAPSARRLPENEGDYVTAEYMDEINILRKQVSDLEQGKMAYVLERTNRVIEREEAVAARERVLAERENELKKAEQNLASERIDVERKWIQSMTRNQKPESREISTQTARKSPSPPASLLVNGSLPSVSNQVMSNTFVYSDRTLEPVFNSAVTPSYNISYKNTVHRHIHSPPPPPLPVTEHSEAKEKFESENDVKHHHHHHHHYMPSDESAAYDTPSDVSDEEFLQKLTQEERKKLSLHYDISKFLDIFRKVFESVDKTETGAASRSDLRRAIRTTSQLRREFSKFGELLRVLNYGTNKVTMLELNTLATKLMLGEPIRKTPPQ